MAKHDGAAPPKSEEPKKPATKRYRTLTPFELDHVRYAIGEVVEMTPAAAQQHLETRSIEPVGKPD